MRKETILVVEDNPQNRKLLRTLLELAEYTVLEAVNGEEGIEIARRLRPDLILMDIGLPGLDGLSATRIIKADVRCAGIPVIAVSAFVMEGEVRKALAAGCAGHIAKPIDTRTFIDEIKTLASETTK